MENVCPYCGEDAGMNELGHKRFIHPYHQAGTTYWADWYRGMKEQGLYRSEVGDLLLLMCDRRKEAAKVSLQKLHAWQRARKEDNAEGLETGE